MTKDKACALVEAVVKMREIATNTQAIEIKAIYPAWKVDVQYAVGDRALHNGKTWVSTVDNNVWEPSAYGWEVVE